MGGILRNDIMKELVKNMKNSCNLIVDYNTWFLKNV